LTVIVGHNADLELNRVEFVGRVAIADLRAYAEFQAGNSDHLRQDTFNLVRPDADFSSIAFSDIDDLFDFYARHFDALNYHIMRRSAWLCQSPPAWRYLERWFHHDPRARFHSAAKVFDTFDAVTDWLILNPAAAGPLESGEGFQEVARYPRTGG